MLTGTGTAGAYHAGVLRALHEAGVRVDLVAGRGVGVTGSLFAAVDGGQRLWDAAGLWKHPLIAQAYGWRWPLRIAGWAMVTAAALLAVPLALLAAAAIAAIVGGALSLATFDGASSAVTSGYARGLETLFAPAALPTILPRLAVLCLVVAAGALGAGMMLAAWRAAARRRVKTASLWRLVGAPFSSRSMLDSAAAGLWNLIRGAATIAPPPRRDLGRRYVELLAENLGQPGFREVLLVVHDLDARRDLLFALLADGHRQRFFGRPGPEGGRASEAFDLAGVGREYVMDALAASLAVPVATDPHLLRFPTEGPWRGETHRLCDRPGALGRLLEEVAAAGAEQIILVSAAPPPGRPHELESGRADPRGRAAEQLAAFEGADLRDLLERASGRFANLYVIRPAHNPLGPLDFSGVFDERSDRRFMLAELVDRGYEDAHHQFIEPVVAAGGEPVAAVQS